MIAAGACGLTTAGWGHPALPLAQVPLPDPSSAASVGWLLLALAALLAAVNQGKKFFDNLKDKPSAGEVRHEAGTIYARQSELRDHVSQDFQEHSNLWSKIGGLERGLTKELKDLELRIDSKDEARTHALHNRLNEILGDVREMRGEMRAEKPKRA